MRYIAGFTKMFRAAGKPFTALWHAWNTLNERNEAYLRSLPEEAREHAYRAMIDDRYHGA